MINLPATIASPQDIDRIVMMGSHTFVIKQGQVVTTLWRPIEADYDILLNWDFNTNTVTLTGEQAGDEQALSDAIAAVGQPAPKLVAGRQLADRINALEGLDIRDLDTNQLKLLLAICVWNQHGLSVPDLKLLHPSQWVRNRDDT